MCKPQQGKKGAGTACNDIRKKTHDDDGDDGDDDDDGDNHGAAHLAGPLNGITILLQDIGEPGAQPAVH